MRNLKKFLALVLAMLMIVSATAMVSADFTDVAADSKYAAAINDLAVKGIVKGTSDTTFGPEQDVTRWQMALFVARAITGAVESDDVWANGIVPFTDVTSYKGAIQCAYLNGIINGTSETTFAPNDGITYVAALKMAVCALGYGEGLSWPWGYYNKAAELGLTANMDLDDLNVALNRAETAQIIYNMIYAAPADGGKTFAAENFSVAAPENTDLFVITATPKQYSYTEFDGDDYNSASDVDGEFVGLQKIVNGVPAGAMLFVAVEDLGLTAENVEDYFNYAVELVNFDEVKGEFTGYVMGDAPKTVTHKDVKFAADNTKIVVDGKTYTGVDSFSGASLINELVIYNGTGVAEEAKMLLTNKDGDIIDETGTILAVFAYESSTGAKYYYDGTNQKVITAAKALDTYGIYVDDAESSDYIKYTTITTAENGVNDIESSLYLNAYELKMFDDDRDGKYERAYYSPIYMGIYYSYKDTIDDEEATVDGLIENVYGEIVDTAKVTYTKAEAKEEGAVSVFTYNKQLQVVNVIDVLEMKTGYIDEIDSTKYNQYTKTGAVKLTIDGTTYEIGYEVEKEDGKTTDGSIMGATLVEYNASNNNKYDADEVATKPFIQYVRNRDAWVDSLNIGEYVGYYAYNGIIVYASALEIEDVYTLTVVDEFTDYDLGKIYLNLWIGGELEEEALVTEIFDDKLEDLSTYKFSLLLNKQNYFYPGTIYEFNKVNDTYALENIVTDANYDVVYGLIDGTAADDTAAGEIEFEDGSTRGARETRLRTSAETVFYFINDAECTCGPDDTAVCDPDDPAEDCDILDGSLRTVEVYVGQPERATITYNADTRIWVDKLGHGTADTNGRASVVFVINAESTEGFFGAAGSTYVLTSLLPKATKVADAEKLGLPENYKGIYYMYASAGLDLANGSRMAIYSKYKLNSNCVYKVDANGVVCTKDEINWGPGVTLGESTGHFNWTGNPGALTKKETIRNYVKYGITDVNSDVADTANDDWGTPNGNVVYHDFLWYTKSSKTLVNNAREDFAAALADVANAVVAAGDAVVDATYSDILGYVTNDVKAFIADVIADAAGAAVTVDMIEFEEIPSDILEVELVTPLVDAAYVGDYVVVEFITPIDGNDYLIDETDRITDIIVVNQNGFKAYTGEEAIEILNAAPQVMWVGDKFSNEDDKVALFEDYVKDGAILFLVGYTNNYR